MQIEKQWYYEDFGQSCGPWTTDQLLQKVQEGEIDRLKLVYQLGQNHWAPLESFHELRLLLGDDHTDMMAQWVVLKVTPQDSGDYKYDQLGPFTVQEILSGLDQGEFQFTDYLWRPGFEDWAPLGDVQDFQGPLLSSVPVDKSLYEKKMREPLDTAVISYASDGSGQMSEVIPVEAKGSDLAQPPWEPEMPTTSRVEEEVSGELVEKTAAVPPVSLSQSLNKNESGAAPLESLAQEDAEEDPEENLGPVKLAASKAHFKTLRTAHALWTVVVVMLLVSGGFWLHLQSPSERAVVAPIVVKAQQEAVRVPADTNALKKKEEPAVQEPVEREPAKAKKKKAKPAKAKTTKKKASPKKPRPAASILKKKGFKQRAFYHHRDQKMVFYAAHRAYMLAQELYSKSTKKASWSSFYRGWKKRLRTVTPVDLRDRRVSGSYLHAQLVSDLNKALKELDQTGKSFNKTKGANSSARSSFKKKTLAKLRRIKNKSKRL